MKNLLESDDARDIGPDLVDRVRRILTALIAAPNMDGVAGMPGLRVHKLSSGRAGTWSLSVSGNWRITFTLDAGEIRDLALEEYQRWSTARRSKSA